MPDLSSGGLYAYVGVFAALVLAGLGFPIPEEIPVVTAGGLVAHAARQHPLEHPVWWLMLPVCILGVIIADSFLYLIGRIGGPHLLELAWVRKYLVPPDKQHKIEDNFHRYGIKILLGARFLPGIRAPIFVMSGVLRMPLYRFLFADGLYAVPGVSLLFTLAYWFTDQVKEVVTDVSSLRPYLAIGGILIVGLFLLYQFWKRRSQTGDPHEIPLVGEIVIKPSINGDVESKHQDAPAEKH
ncbi:MAG: DedA family protein [Gemmataceae bacterium]